MSPPTKETYLAAVQNSANFALPILKNARVARDSETRAPLVWPGAFGVVFRMNTSSNTARAIKCFTADHQTRTERYSTVGDYLDRLLNMNADSSRFLIDCYFVRKGIYADSHWRPLLMMGWIEGEPLNRHVGRLCSQPDPGPWLRALARDWANLGLALHADGLTHGDLQHGNVFVLPDGRLKLIDYDGMCVPSLASKFVVEGGHPNYQHPRRSARFSDRLDAFSVLVILASLLALSVQPQLWAKYDHGRNMLFRKSDFRDTRESPLFKELETLKDFNANRAVSELKRACFAETLDGIPPIETTIALLDL